MCDIAPEVKIHHVKCLKEYFELVWQCKKTFELRKNDRNYRVGDVVVLHEVNGGELTGRTVMIKIAYLLEDCQEYGLAAEHCIFSWNTLLKSSTYDGRKEFVRLVVM